MTACTGPMLGEDADTRTADALAIALCGVLVTAAPRLASAFPELVAGDPNAGLLSQAALKEAGQAATRMAGIRDIWVVGHPDVTRLQARLDADRARIPAPDPIIVAKLQALENFAIDGAIVSIDGVPLPVGEPQIAYYMGQRYFPLFSPQALPHLIYRRNPHAITPADHKALQVRKGAKPALIHLVDYDARHVTDDVQRSLLTYDTAMHRDNLVAVQKTNLPLFIALWRRDMETAKTMALRTPQAMLPPSNPTSRIRSHAKRLLIGTSLMNEYERLFEVIGAIGASGGVTRQSVDALLATTALTPVQPVSAATRTFVAGAIAHTRALHPSMNDDAGPATGDPVEDGIRDAFANTRAYTSWVKRIRWISKQMPALHFLGVEAEMIAAVALIHMIENMERPEGRYANPGCKGGTLRDMERRARVVELATIITANICPASARGILRDRADEGGSTDAGWLAAVPTSLVDNPTLREEVEALFEQAHGLTGALPEPAPSDGERKRRSSPYDRAMARAKRCAFPVNHPGWTMGFRFEAWLRPDAEHAFLRQCCGYVQYDPALAAKRDALAAEIAGPPCEEGTMTTLADIPTGLPRQHPLERIQDLFRRLFDLMQVADLVDPRATVAERRWREAAIREVAPLLAGVSPVTLDPQLCERLWETIDPLRQRIAADGAWNS